MPLMLTTATMVNAMREVLASDDLTQDERDLLERFGAAARAYPMDVIDLLRRKLPSRPYLHEFLAESSLCPPEGPAPRKRDPAHQARMDAIRAQLEEREYDRMTMDVRRQELSQGDAGEMTGVMNSLGEGLNILVAKGTAFAVGYFASMAGGVDPVWNTICGLLGLILGFLVESSLFVVRNSTVEMQNQKKKEAERKKFMQKGRLYRAGLEKSSALAAEGIAGTIGWGTRPGGAGRTDDQVEGGVEMQPLIVDDEASARDGDTALSP